MGPELPPALGGESLRLRDGPEEEREPHEHGVLLRGRVHHRQRPDLPRPSVGELLPYRFLLHLDGQHCLPARMVRFRLRRPPKEGVLRAVQL